MAIDVEEVYRLHGAAVLRRCRRLLRDEDRAMDAMHDVFVKLIVNDESLVEGNTAGLLHRVATRVCLNRLRTQGRQPETSEDELLLRIANAADPEARSVIRSVLARVFGSQTESTATMAVMHFVDGMTFEEVAAEVGMSSSGVRRRLSDLRRRAGELEGTT